MAAHVRSDHDTTHRGSRGGKRRRALGALSALLLALVAMAAVAVTPAAATAGSKQHDFGGDPCPAQNQTASYQYQINVPIAATNLTYTVTYGGPLCPSAAESRSTEVGECAAPPPAAKKCFVLVVVDAHGDGTSTTHPFTMTVSWTEPDPTTTTSTTPTTVTSTTTTVQRSVAHAQTGAASSGASTQTATEPVPTPVSRAMTATNQAANQAAPSTTTSVARAHAATVEEPTTLATEHASTTETTIADEALQTLPPSHDGSSAGMLGWLLAGLGLALVGAGGGVWFVGRDGDGEGDDAEPGDDPPPSGNDPSTAGDVSSEPDAIGGIVEAFIAMGDRPHTVVRETPGTPTPPDDAPQADAPVVDTPSDAGNDTPVHTEAEMLHERRRMADIAMNRSSMPGIFVDSSGEIDDSPDPAWANMDLTFKIELALQEAVASGQLEHDVAAALSELFTEEGILALAAFIVAFAAFNVAGGPFAWAADVVGITFLLATLGDAVITLGDVLYNDVGNAQNKRQFDAAVSKTASALSGLTMVWITTFVGAILHYFGGKAVGAVKECLNPEAPPPAPAAPPAPEPAPNPEPAPPTPDPTPSPSGNAPPPGDEPCGAGKPDLSKGGTWEVDPARSYNAAKAKAEQAAQVNPQGGRANCPNTVRAVDARLSGSTNTTAAAQDLEPGPNGNPKGRVANNRPSNLEQDFGGRFRPMSLADIEAEIQAAGPGARGIVDGSRGPGKMGHLWNVANIDGHVFFIDGQTGQVGVDYSAKGFVKIKLLRTDCWK